MILKQIKAFLKATSKGYQFTIDKPDQAADILIEAAPDLRSRISEEESGMVIPSLSR